MKYADDINIVIPLQRNSNTESEIINEISNVEKWCEEKKLTLNKEKSHMLLCTRNKDLFNYNPVSYTHLTLPTILLV